MRAQKIVLIEDDRILSDALYSKLTDAGFEVERAFDGEEGIAMVLAKKPDLVLLNILLPKMDGLTVAKKLKSNPQTKETPIIILTVLENSEPMAKALESGVYEYLVKSKSKVEDVVKRIQEHFA
ncbi:MAG: response regulator [Candidatus Sungbacteria bacterium]|nr:response regulator [Candidatus Sungbacteria bacterium]